MAKRALVVGLGIGGMAAATGLRRAGWETVVIERSPERRTGGYFTGLFPEGLQAAADLEIDKHLHTRNPVDGGGTWPLSRRGKRERALGFLDQPRQPAAVLRGDIEEALWQSVAGAEEGGRRIEVRFGTVPVETTENGTEADVLLEQPSSGSRYRETFGSRIEHIREAFTGMDDPVVRHALDSLEQAPEFLFDSVHQVKMPRWSKGHVVLLGDAAWCLNLHSGMCATASLRGALNWGRLCGSIRTISMRPCRPGRAGCVPSSPRTGALPASSSRCSFPPAGGGDAFRPPADRSQREAEEGGKDHRAPHRERCPARRNPAGGGSASRFHSRVGLSRSRPKEWRVPLTCNDGTCRRSCQLQGKK